MNLDLTLKATAILFIVAAGIEFAVEDRIALVDVVVANLFFVLSVFVRNHARRIALIAVALAFVVPIGTIRAYLDAERNVATVLIHVVTCGYLAYVGYQRFRAEADALLRRARGNDGHSDSRTD